MFILTILKLKDNAISMNAWTKPDIPVSHYKNHINQLFSARIEFVLLTKSVIVSDELRRKGVIARSRFVPQLKSSKTLGKILATILCVLCEILCGKKCKKSNRKGRKDYTQRAQRRITVRQFVILKSPINVLLTKSVIARSAATKQSRVSGVSGLLHFVRNDAHLRTLLLPFYAYYLHFLPEQSINHTNHSSDNHIKHRYEARNNTVKINKMI